MVLFASRINLAISYQQSVVSRNPLSIFLFADSGLLGGRSIHSVVSKKKTSQALTAILLAALLGFLVYKHRAAIPRSEDSAESTIWEMVEASRASDPERYIRCYTGEMESLLRRNFQDMGPTKFRDYLFNSLRPVKGIAVSSLAAASSTERRVSVEYVYEDRNEVQQVYLRQVGRRWKIFRVEGAERVKTLVPYGTPVRD